MTPSRVRSIWIALGITLIGAIWVLSLIPAPPSMGIRNEDKLHHALAYGTLMWWWGQLFPRLTPRLGLALTFALMGVAIEYVQGATTWRSFDPRDMLANAIGVAMGFALLYTPAGTLLTRIRERTF